MSSDCSSERDLSPNGVSETDYGFESYFTDKTAAEEFYSFYQQALLQWKRVPESEFIRTRFGDTHILRLSGLRESNRLIHADDSKVSAQEADSAQKPLVVLLHGYGATSLMWQSIMPALSAQWDCIACDIPGQLGLSDNHGDRIKFCWQYVTWLHELMVNLGYESRELILIGYSYGGNIAARYAARYKKRIKYVMLIEPAVVFNTIKLDFLKVFMNIQRRKLSAAEMEELMAAQPEFDYYNPFTDAAIAMGFHNYRHRKFIVPLPVISWKLTSLTSRVYVFLAGKSEILHAQRARWIAKLMIPFSHIYVLPEATHLLPAQYPKEIISKLLG